MLAWLRLERENRQRMKEWNGMEYLYCENTYKKKICSFSFPFIVQTRKCGWRNFFPLIKDLAD